MVTNAFTNSFKDPEKLGLINQNPNGKENVSRLMNFTNMKIVKEFMILYYLCDKLVTL